MERENLNIVVVGHVDHGKSTLIGRLLYDTGSVSKGNIEKVKKISADKGKNFEYAYLLDAFEEEQKQGITIDTTRIQFKTEKRDYTIIDAPGHLEFLKNMISGAASAEAALLMVDAKEGIREQSKRHGYILSLLGVKSVYVVVNKMDLVDYSESVYTKIEEDFNKFLEPLGISPERYIPVSAYNGENITENSDKLSWYGGENIVHSIDDLEKELEIEEKELRLPIQDVYKFDDRRIIAGRIESGSLSVGDEIIIQPSKKKTRIKTIEHWQDKDKRDRATTGESIGITVEDEYFYKRGEFITHLDSGISSGNRFRANLFWLGQDDLVKDKKYKLKLSTTEVECEIEEIVRATDASTLAEELDSSAIKKNDIGEIIIKTKTDISFDLFSNLQNTGRFVIVDDYNISGGGIITKSEKSDEKNAIENRLIWSVSKEDSNELNRIESSLSELGKYPERIAVGSDLDEMVESINASVNSGNIPILLK